MIVLGVFCFFYLPQPAISKNSDQDSLIITSVEVYMQSKEFRYSSNFLPPYISLIEICNSEEKKEWSVWSETIVSRARISDFERRISKLDSPSFFKRIFNRKFLKKGDMYMSYVCVKVNYSNDDEKIILFTEKKKELILLDEKIVRFNEDVLKFLLLNSPVKIKEELFDFYKVSR